MDEFIWWAKVISSGYFGFGILVAAGLTYNGWRKGDDIKVAELFGLISWVLLWPVGLVVTAKEWFDEHSDDVLIRGSKSAKVMRELKKEW